MNFKDHVRVGARFQENNSICSCIFLYKKNMEDLILIFCYFYPDLRQSVTPGNRKGEILQLCICKLSVSEMCISL